MLMRGLTPSSDWTHLLAGMIVSGLGGGLVSTPLISTAVGVVEPARAGMASGINSTLRQVGVATGVAALGTILASHVRTSVIDGLSGTPLGGHAHAIAHAVSTGGTPQAIATTPAAAARPRRRDRPLGARRRPEHDPADRARSSRSRRPSSRSRSSASATSLRPRLAKSTLKRWRWQHEHDAEASSGRGRRRLRRPAGGARTPPGAGRRHPGRPAELHALPAARLPGRNRWARAGRDRDAPALGAQAPGQRARRAGGGDRIRTRAAAGPARASSESRRTSSPQLRHADRRRRLPLLLLRPRRVADTCAGAEVAVGRARDPQPHPLGIRGRRVRT